MRTGRSVPFLLLLLLAGGAAPRLLIGSACAQGRAGAETEEEKIFSEAEALFNAGRYAEAAPLYDRALALNSTRPATFVKRATLYFQEHKYDKAIELLTRAERLAPEDLNLKTVLGLCLYQSGQRDAGLRYLQDVATRRPETSEAQLQIGQHYAQTDPDRAIVALEAYLRYRTDEQRGLDGIAQFHLGTAYYLKGKLPQAQQALEAAHKARPRDVPTQLTLGQVLLARGDFARAAALYEPLQDEIPRRPAVAFTLATVYLKQGRKADARRLALLYNGRNPEDPRGQLLLGDIALSGRDPDARLAVRCYERAETLLQRRPSEVLGVLTRVRMGRGHLAAHDPETAVFLLDTERTQLLGRHPEAEPNRSPAISGAEAELLAVLIEAHLEITPQGADGPVVPPGLAERLALLAPGDAGAMALCGSAALSQGNLERARKLYTDARALSPQLQRARAGLARTLQMQAQALLPASGEREGSLGAAAALLEQALPLDDTPATARNLAVVYLMENRPAEAERVLGKLRGGHDVLVQRLHARALVGLGSVAEKAAALKIYEQALGEAEAQTRAGSPAERAAAADQLLGLLVELGAGYIQAGRLDEAISTLERAVGERDARDEAAHKAARRDLALAFLLRGRTLLLDHEAQLGATDGGKLAEAALEDLLRAVPDDTEARSAAVTDREARSAAVIDRRGDKGAALDRKESALALCYAALAAAHTAKYGPGREFLGKAQELGGCELIPPYDRLGGELLRLYISYRDTSNIAEREAAWKSFPKVAARVAQGSAAAQVVALVRTLGRSTGELLAYDYFTLGRLPRAGQLLQGVQKLSGGRGEAPAQGEEVLQHNRAVLDLSQGRAAGERVLERLAAAGAPPEAALNLGVLHDKRGDSKKALDYYRRAAVLGQRGARPREWVGRVHEWISTKERFFGGAQ